MRTHLTFLETLISKFDFGPLSYRDVRETAPWGQFLESPGNVTIPKSYFEIKVSRNLGCVLTSNEVLFVPLVDNSTVPFSKRLKLPSGMENKTA